MTPHEKLEALNIHYFSLNRKRENFMMSGDIEKEKETIKEMLRIYEKIKDLESEVYVSGT